MKRKRGKIILEHTKAFEQDEDATHELQNSQTPQSKSRFRHRNSFFQLEMKE